MKVLVTGSSGLIRSEAVLHYDRLGCQVVGVENDLRREFTVLERMVGAAN